MKAQEYVKKYGIAKAKELVSSIVNTISVGGVVCDPCFITDKGEYVGYNDLKRVVESYDMVEDHGSINRAKMYAESRYTAPEVTDRLKQAILDVESCL